MNDLIFVSLENWDDIWRRNQFVCAALAQRHPERKILFVVPALHLPAAVRNRSGMRGRRSETMSVPRLPNVIVTQPYSVTPNSIAVGRWVNALLMRRHVRQAAQRLNLRGPVLWLNPHAAGHLAGRTGEAAVVYDITDDWISMTQRPWLAELTRRQDAALCRRADAVIVCSQRLYDLKRPLTDKLHLIPNGVDATHYADVTASGPVPAEAAAWGRPVLGYLGTVHADRVDVPLVEAIAGRLKARGGSVVLVGPDFLTVADRQRLAACGNVQLVGPVPYARVPEYLRAFDVCVTPHVRSAFTESLNPIKLFEYLATGKPVVSTDVAGFREFGRLIRIANDADSFVNACFEALDEPAAAGEARKAEAAKHSWASRVDAIEAVIENCLRNAVSRR